MDIRQAKQKHLMQGFTLIEIMVVVVIIGLLVAIVAPNVMGRLEQAEIQAAEADIRNISSTVNFFRMDHSRYPSDDEGLEILLGGVEVNGRKVDKFLPSLPEDPWGNPYIYEYPSTHNLDFDIYTLGADGEEGGEGANADIGNWDLN